MELSFAQQPPVSAVASDGNSLPLDSLPQTLAYGGSGRLSTITVTKGADSYRQDFGVRHEAGRGLEISRMTFDEALRRVLKHEGGYINHPSDPGGETNYGITKAVAMKNGYTGPMRAISMFVVSEIYHKSYWDRTRCDELPPLLRYPVFDAAVNSGASQAVRWLQRALGVTEDGLIGQQTIAAANRADPALIAARLTGYRLAMLAGLKHFDQFGRGWTRRIANVLMEA